MIENQDLAGDLPAHDPRVAARAWLEASRPVAMATVVDTWGSAPIRAGGQMAIASLDEFQGSVSGGCIEAEVIAAALDTIAHQRPAMLAFGVEDETAWRAGLACGGQIKVYVSHLDPPTDLPIQRQIDDAVASRTPLVVVTQLHDGSRKIVFEAVDDLPEVAAVLTTGQSRLVKRESGTEVFLHAIVPAPRIILIGANHIAQHLATMAPAAGYDVKVVDPREAFTSPARFRTTQVISGWPEDGFRLLADDRFAAVVTLTHVDHIDDEALAIALSTPCRYIGALGSRKTHAKRVSRLRDCGFSEQDISRIHAPVGLDIAAVTPGEIAVSILGDIIAAFRTAAPP